MVGVLRHEDVRDGRLRRQAALDQAGRRGGLPHAVAAGSAGVFGPADDEYPELGGDDVEPLGDVLADPVERAPAAGAAPVLDVHDLLDSGKVRREGAAVAPARRRTRLPLRRRRILGPRARLRFGLLDLLEP